MRDQSAFDSPRRSAMVSGVKPRRATSTCFGNLPEHRRIGAALARCWLIGDNPPLAEPDWRVGGMSRRRTTRRSATVASIRDCARFPLHCPEMLVRRMITGAITTDYYSRPRIEFGHAKNRWATESFDHLQPSGDDTTPSCGIPPIARVLIAGGRSAPPWGRSDLRYVAALRDDSRWQTDYGIWRRPTP